MRLRMLCCTLLFAAAVQAQTVCITGTPTPAAVAEKPVTYGGVNLVLRTPSNAVQVGDTFTVNLVAYPESKEQPSIINGGKVVIGFDPTKVELIGITRGDVPCPMWLTGALPLPLTLADTWARGLGLVMFYVPQGDGAPSEQYQYPIPASGVVLVKYTFKAVSPTPSTLIGVLSHDPESWWFTNLVCTYRPLMEAANKLDALRVRVVE